jgi:hypothetical protein
VGNAIAGLSPEFIVLEAEIEIQEVLGTNCGFDFRHVNRDFFLFVRANVHLRTVQFALLDDLAVFLDRPVAIEEVAQVLVEVAAFNLNLALGGINILDDSLGIDWRIPMVNAVLSEKDTKHPFLKDFDSPF